MDKVRWRIYLRYLVYVVNLIGEGILKLFEVRCSRCRILVQCFISNRRFFFRRIPGEDFCCILIKTCFIHWWRRYVGSFQETRIKQSRSSHYGLSHTDCIWFWIPEMFSVNNISVLCVQGCQGRWSWWSRSRLHHRSWTWTGTGKWDWKTEKTSK